MSHIDLYNQEEFSRSLGFVSLFEAEGETKSPSPWGIAEFIRREIRRKGLLTRRELRKVIEPYLLACGFDCDTNKIIRDVGSQMVNLGELVDLKVENQRGYAAIPSRWIRVSATVAVLLGTMKVKEHQFSPSRPGQFLRRFQIADSSNLISVLTKMGIEEQSIDSWFGEPNWKTLVDSANHVETLNGLLETYIAELEHAGLPVSIGESKIKAITHQPGEFFGQPWTDGKSRWQSITNLEDGIYLAAHPGYNERQWHPILLSLKSGSGKSIALNCRNNIDDTFQLRNWLLIALSAKKQKHELIRHNTGPHELQVMFPAPRQINDTLCLAGSQTGKWQQYYSTDWNRVKALFLKEIPQVHFVDGP